MTSCATSNSNQERVVIVNKPYLICPVIDEISKDEQAQILTEYDALSARDDKPARAMQRLVIILATMREKARECQKQNELLKKEQK